MSQLYSFFQRVSCIVMSIFTRGRVVLVVCYSRRVKSIHSHPQLMSTRMDPADYLLLHNKQFYVAGI